MGTLAVEMEIGRREAIWRRVKAIADPRSVDAEVLNELRVYRGSGGIWLDKTATGDLHPDGVAVALRHTGRHYADTLESGFLIFDLQNTFRSGRRDESETNAIINACQLSIPLFVVDDAPNGKRAVHWARVAEVDLESRCCLVQLNAAAPAFDAEPRPTGEFDPYRTHRVRDAGEIARIERDPRFKFNALLRYGAICAVTDVQVHSMLDAVHIVPVAEGGTDDVRNALLLNAAVRRAFDAQLWAIEPGTRKLAVRAKGPSLEEMQLTRTDINHLTHGPAVEALELRWQRFVDATDNRWQLARDQVASDDLMN